MPHPRGVGAAGRGRGVTPTVALTAEEQANGHLACYCCRTLFWGVNLHFDEAYISILIAF